MALTPCIDMHVTLEPNPPLGDIVGFDETDTIDGMPLIGVYGYLSLSTRPSSKQTIGGIKMQPEDPTPGRNSTAFSSSILARLKASQAQSEPASFSHCQYHLPRSRRVLPASEQIVPLKPWATTKQVPPEVPGLKEEVALGDLTRPSHLLEMEKVVTINAFPIRRTQPAGR